MFGEKFRTKTRLKIDEDTAQDKHQKIRKISSVPDYFTTKHVEPIQAHHLQKLAARNQ